VLCQVVLTVACSLDSELSPDIPANAVSNADDDDAGRKRRAKKLAPTPTVKTETHPDPHASERGPYNEDDPWSGYLWIAKNGEGTTLTVSKSFALKTFEEPVCIRGSVAATTDSSGNAMVGMNVNQDDRSDAPPLALVPRLEGMQVEVQGNAASPLRVQVAARDGTTNPDARWCAAVPGAGGFIPWTAFNTACWDGSGKAYKNEEISGAMLLVPGSAHSPVAYDFCLRRLAESDGPTPGVGAGSAPPEDD